MIQDSMSPLDQLLAGLELTITGMVTVFLLLTFMVFVIQGMSKLALRLQPQVEAPPLPRSDTSEPPDPDLVSAITAAIHRYRSDRH
jgi:sodium pump decarboxylase gamma subunit